MGEERFFVSGLAIFLPFWMVILCSGNTSVAQSAKPPSNIDLEASCTTGDCHASVSDYPVVHLPVLADDCQQCHIPKRNKHAFEEIMNTPELCNQCHDPVGNLPNVHLPVLDDCLICHNPHGGPAPFNLKAVNQQEICFQCHDEELMGNEFQHGPSALGACSICHNPHSSTEEKFLRKKPRELCKICHTKFVQAMDAARYLHPPAEENCVLCHNPHSGPSKRMLPGPTHVLCAKCHEDVVKTTLQSEVRHGPAEEENGCINCHSPHGAESAPLLKMPQVELCLSCHDKPVQAQDKMLKNMKAWLDANKEWHGPIRDDNCAACHQPHGSVNFRILKEPFPPDFYSPFDPSKYALCFKCHEKTMVEEAFTDDLTNFRDGERNLHYLHVNKEERGRTCRACHEVHASPYPRRIRATVPYGSWDLPTNFKISESGGSCHPGCHAKKTYDRLFPQTDEGKLSLQLAHKKKGPKKK
ncbi:MAG: cytochrome C [Candidatus Hydrogenedentes bacterium]|nr:cytochrome C [Candidatus Hydrogenedentota bacterium]